MKETFLKLCKLWSFLSFCVWSGTYTKAVDTCRMIEDVAKGHPVLNFMAMHFYAFF